MTMITLGRCFCIIICKGKVDDFSSNILILVRYQSLLLFVCLFVFFIMIVLTHRDIIMFKDVVYLVVWNIGTYLAMVNQFINFTFPIVD